MHYIRNKINIYHLIRHARIRSCHSFYALSIDLLSFIGGFEIDLTSFFSDGYLLDYNGNNSTWDASYIMHEL